MICSLTEHAQNGTDSLHISAWRHASRGLFSPTRGCADMRVPENPGTGTPHLKITIWSEGALSAGSSTEPTLRSVRPLKYRGSWMGDSCSSSAALSITQAVSTQRHRGLTAACADTSVLA